AAPGTVVAAGQRQDQDRGHPRRARHRRFLLKVLHPQVEPGTRWLRIFLKPQSALVVSSLVGSIHRFFAVSSSASREAMAPAASPDFICRSTRSTSEVRAPR